MGLKLEMVFSLGPMPCYQGVTCYALATHRYMYSFFPAFTAPSFLYIHTNIHHIIPTAPSGLDTRCSTLWRLTGRLIGKIFFATMPICEIRKLVTVEETMLGKDSGREWADFVFRIDVACGCALSLVEKESTAGTPLQDIHLTAKATRT